MIYRVRRPPSAGTPSANPQGSAAENGQITVLIIGFVMLALLVSTVVMAASSLYIEHKKLLSLADGASVAAAGSFTLGEVETAGGTPSAALSGGTGVDNVWEQEKTPSHQKRLKTRRLPPVGCTLCWAAFIHTTL